MRKIGKGSHKVFNTVVKDILQHLPPLGEYGSEVSHLITEPRNFAEVKNYQITSITLDKSYSKGYQKPD